MSRRQAHSWKAGKPLPDAIRDEMLADVTMWGEAFVHVVNIQGEPLSVSTISPAEVVIHPGGYVESTDAEQYEEALRRANEKWRGYPHAEFNAESEARGSAIVKRDW